MSSNRAANEAARLNPASIRLIAVTDSMHDGVDGLVARAVASVRGGATMIQVRLPEESVRRLVAVSRALVDAVGGVPVLVSARADVALAAGAAGVHLGVDDVTPAAVRRIAPSDFLIGSSVGDVGDVERATGADYVAIGPVFRMARGTDGGAPLGVARLRDLALRCALPVVAVGGITGANARGVLSAGAVGIAVISALFSAPDPQTAAFALRGVLDAPDASGT